MLNTAPCTLPYSAVAPSDSTSISSIASVLGYGHDAPLMGAVKSVPSSWYEFSLVPEPNEVCRFPSSDEVEATPGAALIRSKNELRGMGALRTQSLS